MVNTTPIELFGIIVQILLLIAQILQNSFLEDVILLIICAKIHEGILLNKIKMRTRW